MNSTFLTAFVRQLPRFIKRTLPYLFAGRRTRRPAALSVICVLVFGSTLPLPFTDSGNFLPSVSANGNYHNFNSGNMSLSLTALTTNLITSNNDWTAIASVEGYEGRGLTATHGVNPQTILGTEFTNNLLPNAGNTQINANKGNPNAYNAGGLTEFDTGLPLAFGFQGNVQANPYMVFYLNTTGRTSVTMSYEVIDIDNGSNNSVSPLALQYRIGQTGNFTNISAGFVADATDGPNLSGRVTYRSVVLPPACSNQAQVQIRLITTNAADSTGSSAPDEWIGVNNIVITALAPSAANATIGGRVFSPSGRPLSGARIMMYDATGNVRTATTNLSGYYRFADVPVGATYVLEIRSKRYVFPQPTQVVAVNEDLHEVNFYAAPPAKEFLDFPLKR
jgi:hypothetical protein